MKNQQTFNDGVVSIYSVSNIAELGNMAKDGLTLIESLRFHERTVGLNRFYVAKQSGNKVVKVIRCPWVEVDDSTIIVAILSDKQYQVIQIQTPEDVFPKSIDLTLERLATDYVID